MYQKFKTHIMADRINRSKYNFSKLEVGDTFNIPPIDHLSMKNSLRFYNSKHRKGKKDGEGKPLKPMVLTHVEISASELQITRTA